MFFYAIYTFKYQDATEKHLQYFTELKWYELNIDKLFRRGTFY